MRIGLTRAYNSYLLMTTIRERLADFAKTQGFKSLSGFEIACGFTKNTLTKDREGISSTTLVKIVDNFPQLSLDWVILGRGSMTVEESPTPHPSSVSPAVSIGSIQTVNIGNWGELVEMIKGITK